MHPVSFVVRLWADSNTGSAEPEWRFHVLHVQSGKEAYCRSFAELKRYVETWTALPGPVLSLDGESSSASGGSPSYQEAADEPGAARRPGHGDELLPRHTFPCPRSDRDEID